MEQEFIPYEQALALKELGFHGKRFFNYYKTVDGKLIQSTQNDYSFRAGVPLYQQAFRWFREKYDLLASPKINEFHDRFYFTIRATEPRLMKEIILKHEINYEEAELECLKKLIEIVKKK